MSAEIVITIVGAALILCAIADAAFSLGLMKTGLRLLLGASGILLMMYGGYSFGAMYQQGPLEQVDVGNQLQVEYPVQRVQVISPLEGDSVKCRILTMGVYPDAHDEDIWVLLKPTDNKYYPQSDHTNTSYKRDGEWQVITRFGGDQGEPYELIVYEADASASQFFSATIEDWKEMESYPGLELAELPPTAREVDRMIVVLEDNCRGVF
jgi:hypothetical protein